ncbi:MAG: AMP-binding protein [bacterium]
MKGPELTIIRTFDQAANRHENFVALSRVTAGKKLENSYTYGELSYLVKCFATGMSDLGMRKGDKVAILSENRPEWAISYLGITGMGAVAVQIMKELKAPEVTHIMRNSGQNTL